MAYTTINMRAHGSNYYSSSKRSLKVIKKIAVHYTGNNGDTATSNCKYFQTANRQASAHYFIDDKTVACSVPDCYTAYAVGGGKKDQGSPYASKGAKYYKKYTNSNTLSIELCDPVKDNKIALSSGTRANAVTFIAKKLKELGLTENDLIRHFDVNGKLCPIYFVTNESDWNKFKKEVGAKLASLKGTTTSTSTSTTKTKPTIAQPTLKVGSSGTQVKYLQQDLNYILGTKLSVDSKFGDGTKDALKKFQTKYKLTVDGAYGPKSYEKMKSLLK